MWKRHELQGGVPYSASLVGGGQMTERGVGTRGNGSGQKAGKSGAKRPKRQERRARLFEQIMKLEESERTG